MITENMNTEEVIKELRKVHYFVAARMDGLLAKNNKKLKSRFVENGDVMSISHYTVPETQDTVTVLMVKRVLTHCGKDYASIRMLYYVKTYYGTYIMSTIDQDTNRVEGCIIFTRHFLTRLKERLGKDFETFVKDDWVKRNGGCLTPLEYLRGENDYYSCAGDGFLFLKIEDGGKKRVVVTILSDKELFANQLTNKKVSQEINDESNATIVDDLERNYKWLKSGGYIRRIA